MKRVVVYGVLGFLALVILTKVIPKVLSIAGNVMSVLISLGVVALVVFLLIGFLKWRLEK